MRVRYPIVIWFVLACCVPAFSQSALNFPRLFSPADLATTGFAVVNPGTASAAVTFTLFGVSGNVVAVSAQTIPAAGQLALLGSQLFPAASEAGWVRLTSTTPGLQGFWVGGDFTTFTDGADAAPVSNDLVFPLVTKQTELNIANTAASAASVTMTLAGEDGTELAARVTQSIPANGVLQSQASTLFPGANLDNARYVRVTGAAGLTGTAVITGFLVDESGVSNAISVAEAGTQANFPHVISGSGAGGNYTTVLGITNLAAAPQTVEITFTPEAGTLPVNITRSIPANGSLRETAESLFGFTSGFQNGWVHVAGAGPLAAFVAYADRVAGGFAVVPMQTAPKNSLMFAHIADLPPWLTGIALLNAGSSTATVSVYAMTPAGTLIGGADNVPTARFQLNAGAKTARLLSEWIPQTQQRSADGGFIFISSTQPLYGIELFFSRTLRIFANVGAGSGAGFAPPAAPVPLALTSISPARAAAGSTLTLMGSGFSPNAAANAVIFTAASGKVSVVPGTASSTTLAAQVPPTAITGPVAVQAGGQISAPKILEVVADATSLMPPATVIVDTAGTTSGIDIYVPPPAAGLNVTQIGAGNPGTSIMLGSSSVEIARGQTRQLVLAGTGMSAAAGTSVSISGGGVTVGSPVFQGNFVFVVVTAAAGAAPGARNIVVTNSNLDQSVFSGGLFIR